MAVASQIENTDAEIIRSAYGDLRRFAAAVAPWDMDPDDILHAVLVVVLRRRNLHEINRPIPYLQTAILNQIRSELRKNQGRRRLVALLRSQQSPAATPAYPSDLAELMRLRPVERAVLFLHDIEGMPFDEVAGAIGISAGSARVAASRARRRLKTLLEDQQ